MNHRHSQRRRESRFGRFSRQEAYKTIGRHVHRKRRCGEVVLRGGLGGTSWSGWSIRENIVGHNAIRPTDAWQMSEAELKTNTVFRLQPASMNTNTIPRLVRDMHLTQGIPARTPAAGTMKWGPITMNQSMYNLNSINEDQNGIPRPNVWPVRTYGWLITTTWETEWLHSDMKDMAYRHVFPLYKHLIETLR